MDFQELAGKYRSELLDNVLPFWLTHSQDKEFGGYFFCLNREGSVHVTDKFIVLQCPGGWLCSMRLKKLSLIHHRRCRPTP